VINRQYRCPIWKTTITPACSASAPRQIPGQNATLGTPPQRLSPGRGKSDVPNLISGHFLTLSEHPRTDWNDLWLITSLHHEGTTTAGAGRVGHQRRQSIRRIHPGLPQPVSPPHPGMCPFRPQLQHPKPKVLGKPNRRGHRPGRRRNPLRPIRSHQGAVPLGSAKATGNDQTICWLRVSSSWAGNQYGGIAIPRIGMEVLITFLEGDPDQPLVTGCPVPQDPSGAI